MNFNLDNLSRILPVWENELMQNEIIMFLGENDTCPLLFDADKIIEITSCDKTIKYVEGVDWNLTDNRIVRTSNSTIPYMPINSMFFDSPNYKFKTYVNGALVSTCCDPTILNYQICVTYTHKIDSNFPIIQKDDNLSSFIKKLENHNDVTIAFFGDSITYGYDTSGATQRAPYEPTWPMYIVLAIAKKYGYTIDWIEPKLEATCGVPNESTSYGKNGIIHYYNPSVGGWSSWGANQKFDEYMAPIIKKYGCDLFITSLGMNDDWQITFEREYERQKLLIEKLETIIESPDVLLVSPLLPNPTVVAPWKGNQHIFEDVFVSFSNDRNALGKHTAVAKVSTVFKAILNKKRYFEITSDNLHHPNDFLGGIYAQVVIKTLIG